VDRLAYEIDKSEDTYYIELVKQRYEIKQFYYFNKTDIAITNMTYHSALSLSLIDLQYISQLPMPEFNINNQHIATFVYNSAADTYTSLTKNLNMLLTNSINEFNTATNNSTMIFFVFLIVYAVLLLIQIPLGCFIHSSLNKEAELFLYISRKNYIKLSKSANSLILYIKVFFSFRNQK